MKYFNITLEDGKYYELFGVCLINVKYPGHFSRKGETFDFMWREL